MSTRRIKFNLLHKVLPKMYFFRSSMLFICSILFSFLFIGD